MELQYSITKQDYVAFQLTYYRNNAFVQRSILRARIMTAALVLLGGPALMYFLNRLSLFSAAVYIVLAAACFLACRNIWSAGW